MRNGISKNAVNITGVEEECFTIRHTMSYVIVMCVCVCSNALQSFNASQIYG